MLHSTSQCSLHTSRLTLYTLFRTSGISPQMEFTAIPRHMDLFNWMPNSCLTFSTWLLTPHYNRFVLIAAVGKQGYRADNIDLEFGIEIDQKVRNNSNGPLHAVRRRRTKRRAVRRFEANGGTCTGYCSQPC